MRKLNGLDPLVIGVDNSIKKVFTDHVKTASMEDYDNKNQEWEKDFDEALPNQNITSNF